MKTKKLLSRFTSLMLVLAMLLSMSAGAFAAEDEPQEPAEVVTQQETDKTGASEDVQPPADPDEGSGENSDGPADSETPPESPEITDDKKTEDNQPPPPILSSRMPERIPTRIPMRIPIWKRKSPFAPSAP